MGRPKKTDTPASAARAAPGPSRRGFFLRSGAAAVVAAGAPLAALAQGRRQSEDGGSVFQHGVASGDPLADRVILWTRVTLPAPRNAVSVEWLVAADPALTQVVTRGTTKTNPGRDYTVKVDAVGLLPGATYYYRFSVDGIDSPVGRTKTLPVGSTQSLRMAVVSCSNHAHGYFNGYGRIAERADLDLVLHLGDYIYEYGNGVYGTARPTEPLTEIVTLTDYRQRHAQYKRDADSQAMHRQHPLVPIWDDHETTDNAWTGGANNHQPATEGDWNTRVNVALQAYYEWMPVRVFDHGDKRRNNRSLAYGDLAEIIMLEERLSGRSEQLGSNVNGGGFTQTGAYADPTRQMLGEQQEAWLFDTLRSSPTRWKLIGQGVMFAQWKAVAATNAAGGGVFRNSDAWDGYQPARDRIYAVIKGGGQQARVDNVVVMTGDIHSSWAADLTPDPNNPDPAAGGYDAATGAGSEAVEFVGTSISSPGANDPTGAIANSLKPPNPHFKYINLHQRGYMLVDVAPQRTVCEWWHLDTVATPSTGQSFAIAFQTVSGGNRLQPASQTPPRANPPPLAP